MQNAFAALEGIVVVRLRPKLVSIASTGFAAAVVIAVSVAPIGAAAPLFVGDYSTGDFSQWPVVQTRNYNDSGSDYVPTYSASIVQDAVKGNVARFEVRAGDVPSFGGGERAEVSGADWDTATGGSEGQTRWYRFATKFDSSFPLNHADLGWAVTNQWHSPVGGSPPVSWTVDMKNGYWSLVIEKQAAPGTWLEQFSIFDTPLNVGQWHDVMMQVNWSTSDETGWVRLWLNGIRQTFVNGADSYYVRTLIPGTTAVYYKEGMYREPTASTDIVYHTGFRSANSEPAL
jgi:Polysaccharide lyase